MFNDLLQFYKIGKDLGLSRKEINQIFFFQKKIPLSIGLLVILIVSILTFFLWNIIVLIYLQNSGTVYAEGTLYGSVSINDFKRKR